MSPSPSSLGTLADLRFGVVDVETSGLSASKHRVLQVAVVTVDGNGTVLDSWVSLIRPRNRWFFRLGPQHIHGLTRSALRSAPPAKTVLAELASRLAGTTFTAHNAKFDAGFLQQSAQRASIDLHLSAPLCTLKLSRRLDPGRTMSHKLVDVCVRYGVSLDRPHDALEDALATAGVLPFLLHAHGVSNADQVSLLSTP